MKRKQFTFYASYYDAVKVLPKRSRADVFMAICAYCLDGEEPVLHPNLRETFETIRPAMDAEIRQSIEGRHSKEYKDWRSAVFARDNFTCQLCGIRGVRMNAHHKKQYAYFPELRFCVDNGATLCECCHRQVHGRCQK